MAKCETGDVVEIISGRNKGERGTVGSPNAGTENGKTLVSVYGDVKYIVPEDSLRLANARTPRSSNAVVRNALAAIGSGIEAANAHTARNATMGEIKAQLNPAKVKEAYQLLRKAADALDRCIPALKASNIAKAWPRMAEMYGEASSKLSYFMMHFEGELQDMIR